jgi:hypothetical protein
MGSASATVTATYKAIPPPQYTLTVNNGSGSGSYTAGTVVNISANAAPSGQMFDKWTGNTSGIADVNASSTTYTMGSASATVTATYKAIPDGNETVGESVMKVYATGSSLCIQNVVEKTTVKICDFSGRVVYVQVISGDINVSLSRGFYVVITTNSKGSEATKVVIK